MNVVLSGIHFEPPASMDDNLWSLYRRFQRCSMRVASAGESHIVLEDFTRTVATFMKDLQSVSMFHRLSTGCHLRHDPVLFMAE